MLHFLNLPYFKIRQHQNIISRKHCLPIKTFANNIISITINRILSCPLEVANEYYLKQKEAYHQRKFPQRPENQRQVQDEPSTKQTRLFYNTILCFAMSIRSVYYSKQNFFFSPGKSMHSKSYLEASYIATATNYYRCRSSILSLQI